MRSLFLSLVLCFGFGFSVYASDDGNPFDPFDIYTDEPFLF